MERLTAFPASPTERLRRRNGFADGTASPTERLRRRNGFADGTASPTERLRRRDRNSIPELQNTRQTSATRYREQPSLMRGILLLLCFLSIVPFQLQGQSSLLSNGDGELIFQRDPNTFHESVDIKLELVGVVFNERGYYSTTVDPQHQHANYYPAGPYLTGTGPNASITLPTSGSPSQITWESAAYDDSRPLRCAHRLYSL